MSFPQGGSRKRMAGDVFSDPTATAMGLKDLLPLAVGAGLILGGGAAGAANSAHLGAEGRLMGGLAGGTAGFGLLGTMEGARMRRNGE